MELLVSLHDKSILERLSKSGIDGFIFGGQFSMKYNYSNEEIKDINDFCLINNLKRYISIDAFILENDKNDLYNYLDFISSLNSDGIYFNDMAIIYNAEKYGLQDKLIYDPSTLMTNANDISFYKDKGIDVVLARELTLDEIIEIVKKYPYELDMQVFGHLRMSYSKRKFLTNYFKEINKDIDIVNKEDITLVEETRNYKTPIKETKYGTSIYTDYVLLIYEEYAYLNKLLKRAIIDSEFISNDILFEVLRDAKRISVDNSGFLKSTFIKKHPEIDFSTGYLYQKTVNKKEDNE
ncbi:MAG: U32 family peptidase [Erysipelotrichaceae bacterium]|nr:U32 family peptidase [Erysipelotrichaceae bacterium]